MDSISSVPEHQAVGQTAELYSDIKETLRVPVTNLMWRHLATIDGALECVWKSIKPLYRHADLDTGAASLRNINGLPTLPRWTRSGLKSLGITGPDLITLHSILSNYAISNPGNLIALMALRAKLEGKPAIPIPIYRHDNDTSGAVTCKLPRLIAAHEMSPDTQRAAQEFDRIGIDDTSREIVAGVPRHLAHWPAFLSRCTQTLLPFEADISHGILAVQDQAQQCGQSLIPALDRIDVSPEPHQILTAIELFTSRELIANYIVKVQMLQAALPE
jgi:hypothetical protein